MRRASGSSGMRERNTVWLELADKSRPGVVVEVREELVRVAYGTTKEQPKVAAAVVHHDTRAGRKFPLKATTYFYGANVAWELRASLRSGSADCTRELFNEIRRLIEEHDARLGDE